jgi:type II secretory pathway component GspD/PulD (secretin)
VDVFDVLVDRTTDYGINWDAMINAIGGTIAVDSGKAVSPLGNPINDVVKFTYPKTTGCTSPTGTGFFDCAVALFQALSTVGDTSKVTGTTVYTVNGEPTPVQVVKRQDYISNITFSAVSDQSSTTQVAITPATIVSGFFMVVTPSILSDNQILLNLTFSLSTADITTNTQTVCPTGQTTNCPSIALPIVNSKNFMETVTLNAGQSVILSGFQDLDNEVGISSVADPALWPLGGNKATNHTKTITVTLVTPYLIGR